MLGQEGWISQHCKEWNGASLALLLFWKRDIHYLWLRMALGIYTVLFIPGGRAGSI
jgi:hypothetical protein